MSSVTSRLESFDVGTPMSVAESTTSTLSTARDNDSVKVLVRIRPPSTKEIAEGNELSVQKTSDASLQLKTPEGYKNFAFDAVVGDNVDQEILFQTYAASIVERCLSGYNGCIFAYGQTGSGKTHTMLGDVSLENQRLNKSAGIIPRAFKYLFELLEERKAEMTGKMDIECKCSFLEIYNETITDLLNPTKTNLHVREDKSGTHAAGLTEQLIQSMEQAVALMNIGMANRKVAHTQMNAESSRSHSILSCIVTTKRHNDNGVVSIFRSRLNLVDLAGSERQRTTGASGTRLKEAASINKSLSTLGLVIMSLGDAKGKKPKHVPYRDSKLTFLLQDSLGGNANAVMISNISPSTKNINETLSTLRFARGAKRVKNKAVANHDCVGNISSLKAEITHLKQELKILKEKQAAEELKREKEAEEMLHSVGEGTNEDGIEEVRGLDKTLASALRREDSAHRTVLALSEEIVLLQSALEIKQSEIRKYKLIGKLKDDKIQRLEDMIYKQSRMSNDDDQEIQRLKNEVEFFKEKASRVPDATQYAIENLQLKQELSTLKWSMECNDGKARFDEQINQLRAKLLEMYEEMKKYKERNEEREVVEESETMSVVIDRSKIRKDREELIARYLSQIAKWARTVVGVITKPLKKLRLKLKKKQMD